ncbi:MAG: helix-turn-helix domain-containing protein [Bacteroidota bacterium]
MKEIKMRSDCPVSYALDFFGDKWSFLVIRDLALEGKSYYKEFLQSKEKIATNILADRLKKLEYHGIIESKVDEQLRTKKVYSLTAKGKDLMPILLEMMVWSNKYQDDLAVSDEFIEKVKHDRDTVLKSLLDRLEKE